MWRLVLVSDLDGIAVFHQLQTQGFTPVREYHLGTSVLFVLYNSGK